MSCSLRRHSNELKPDDNDTDMEPIIKKVMGAKLFEDDDGGLWKQSVQDCQGEILCSEFSTFLHMLYMGALILRGCRTSGGRNSPRHRRKTEEWGLISVSQFTLFARFKGSKPSTLSYPILFAQRTDGII